MVLAARNLRTRIPVPEIAATDWQTTESPEKQTAKAVKGIAGIGKSSSAAFTAPFPTSDRIETIVVGRPTGSRCENRADKTEKKQTNPVIRTQFSDARATAETKSGLLRDSGTYRRFF